MQKARIGILVVAYNAATTLAKVLDRIPEEIRPDIEEVIVSDDHSQDSTYLVGLGYKQVSDLPITLIRQPTNLGYGGNQKAGYDLAIEHGLDVVVMLHGDGQYAPESLPEMVAPILDGQADAVFGSRTMIKGAARKGGMPLYKYVGNRILTRFENAALGTDLSEFHSGYRAYSVSALKQIPFERNSDGFNFDTQIIIQLHDAGLRITEVPIPTYYGDEICYVDGLGYARDVSRDVVAYRLQKAGFGDGSLIALNEEYQLKPSEDSSHGRISTLMGARPPSKVLDLGCSGGRLAKRLREMGHHVTGVDVNEIAGVYERTDAFFRADLNDGIPFEVGSGFDVVLGADVLEHLVNPGALISQAGEVLS
ncbi:MAG: glycosyltransferase, partial [Acidimicrobiales bacterium]